MIRFVVGYINALISNTIKILVNFLRQRGHLSLQLGFNLKHEMLDLVSDEIDRETVATKSTTSANSVEIGFSSLWEVKIDYQINAHYVNSSG